MKRLIVLLPVCSCWISGWLSHGTTFAASIIESVDPHAAGVEQFDVNNFHGYEFNLAVPVMVTSLGWYDEGEDGLAGSFVGLYDLDANLLATTVIATRDPLINGFRMRDLSSPVTLQPGNYVLAGQTQGNDAYLLSQCMNCSFVTFDPSVTWIRERWSNFVEFPRNTSANFALFGPNAHFVPVPEPSALLLAITTLFGLSLTGLPRRRQAVVCTNRTIRR